MTTCVSTSAGDSCSAVVPLCSKSSHCQPVMVSPQLEESVLKTREKTLFLKLSLFNSQDLSHVSLTLLFNYAFNHIGAVLSYSWLCCCCFTLKAYQCWTDERLLLWRSYRNYSTFATNLTGAVLNTVIFHAYFKCCRWGTVQTETPTVIMAAGLYQHKLLYHSVWCSRKTHTPCLWQINQHDNGNTLLTWQCFVTCLVKLNTSQPVEVWSG